MPRLKSPCALDSRPAAPPNAAGQGGSSRFCPFEGVFHNRQNGRYGAQCSKATATRRERAVVERVRRRRTWDISSAIPKSAACCMIALMLTDVLAYSKRVTNNANVPFVERLTNVVRKNVSSVRKRRRTDHRRARVYDGDSAISAAIAAKTEPLGERGRD